MDDAEEADRLRFREAGQEPAEFQTPGWEDRLRTPTHGWRLAIYQGRASGAIVDYYGMAPDTPRGNVSYVYSTGRFWVFGAWFRRALPFSVQQAFFFGPRTFLFVLLLLLWYPAIAFVHGPVRRFHRRRCGHCVKCGYDLTGNASGACPECGTPSTRRPVA